LFPYYIVRFKLTGWSEPDENSTGFHTT